MTELADPSGTMKPGAVALVLTPCGARARASDLVIWATPA
jgi:hypothetical protein